MGLRRVSNNVGEYAQGPEKKEPQGGLTKPHATYIPTELMDRIIDDVVVSDPDMAREFLSNLRLVDRRHKKIVDDDRNWKKIRASGQELSLANKLARIYPSSGLPDRSPAHLESARKQRPSAGQYIGAVTPILSLLPKSFGARIVDDVRQQHHEGARAESLFALSKLDNFTLLEEGDRKFLVNDALAIFSGRGARLSKARILAAGALANMVNHMDESQRFELQQSYREKPWLQPIFERRLQERETLALPAETPPTRIPIKDLHKRLDKVPRLKGLRHLLRPAETMQKQIEKYTSIAEALRPAPARLAERDARDAIRRRYDARDRVPGRQM